MPRWCWLLLSALVLACTTSAQEEPGGTEPGLLPPDPPATAAPAPPAAGLGEPVTVLPGVVTVQAGGGDVALGAPLTGEVASGLGVTIYLEDMHSDCSILTLERQDGAAWLPLGECAMERAARVLAIGPGRGRAVTIHPGSVHFAATPVTAGTYRLVARYWLTAAPGPDAAEVAVSAPFTVR